MISYILIQQGLYIQEVFRNLQLIKKQLFIKYKHKIKWDI